MGNGTLTKNNGKALKREIKAAYKELNRMIDLHHQFQATAEFTATVDNIEWLYRLRNRLLAENR